MPDIEKDLQDILAARYGREVRDSIHDAIRDINEVVDGNVGTVTAITERAENAASRAETSAQGIDVYAQRAETAANNAKASETEATRLATEVLPEAVQAGQKALTDATTAHLSDLQNQFNTDIAALGSKVIEAESYTKGGTGSRPGEDTDNAKYYMEEAKKAAGGDYIPRSEKGSPSGVATLGNDGKLDASQIQTASKTLLGAVRVGENLNITPDGVLSANAQHIDVDAELSTTSENPVQNKVITAELEDVKKSVGDGKALVASAVTEKGIATEIDASFETIARNILQISAELHGAEIAVATEESSMIGKDCVLKYNNITIQTQIVSLSGVAIFTNIQEAGDYVIYISDGTFDNEKSISISTDDIIYKNIKTIKIDFIPKETWERATLTQVRKMLSAHYDGLIDISDYWKVGDEKEITLSEMSAMSPLSDSHVTQSVKLRIIGLGHDDFADGRGKTALTVQQADCLIEPGTTQVNKWSNTARRKWCNETYYNAIPLELRELIKQVSKQASIRPWGGGGYTETVQDFVFLLAESEIFSSTPMAICNEGARYEFYKTGSAKKKNRENGDYVNWWLRGVISNNTNYYTTVNASGSNAYSVYNNLCYLAPAFCL